MRAAQRTRVGRENFCAPRRDAHPGGIRSEDNYQSSGALISGTAAPDVRYRLGWWAATAALVVGLTYTAVSAYWGLGGRWLLATVGSSLDTDHQRVPVILAVSAAVVLKAAGALIPLQACRPAQRSNWHPRLRKLAWAEGAALMIYGFVLTSVGLLVQADVIHPGRTADRRALAWHAYFWDPWFLVWGLLVVITLTLNPTDRGKVGRLAAYGESG
jgi:hypothetical protein